jgi:hypothetical protein
MKTAEPVKDPRGNKVYLISSFLGGEVPRDYSDLRRVIEEPAYAIEIREEAIYFFRMLEDDLNMVIETKFFKEELIATGCMENPGVGYVSELLKKGALISFSRP